VLTGASGIPAQPSAVLHVGSGGRETQWGEKQIFPEGLERGCWPVSLIWINSIELPCLSGPSKIYACHRF